MTRTPTSRIESAVIARARRGEEGAWRELFDLHYPRLYRFFRSRVETASEAEELSSDVFLRAHRAIRRFERCDGSFGAWLFDIARHTLGAFVRSERPGSAVDAGELGHVPIRSEFLTAEVVAVLQRLSPSHRGALELRYVLGLSDDEAAAALGRSRGTFAALLDSAAGAYEHECDLASGWLPPRLSRW